jgi:hypothetical protein
LLVHDLTCNPAAEEDAWRVISDVTRKPFALDTDPLLRITAIEFSRDEYLLFFSFHEICADGWSERIFFQELETLYNSAFDHIPPQLPKLSAQYADWALWQRKQLTKWRQQQLLSWWRESLSESPAITRLPYRRIAQDLPTDGRRVRRPLSELAMSRLRNLIKQQRTTMYTALVALYGLSMAKCSGQQCVLIGAPEANRERPEMQNIIGFCLNTLVLRINASGNPSFLEFLRGVHNTILEAYKHKDLPFELLAAGLGRERSAHVPPLVQTCFTYRSVGHRGKMSLTGCDAAEVDLEFSASRFILTFGVDETTSGAFVWSLFDNNVLAGHDVERLTAGFAQLLQDAVENPDAHIDDLSKVSVWDFCFDQAHDSLNGSRTNGATDEYLGPKASELCAAMSEMLGGIAVNVHDNFFQLGGHSLLAVRFLTAANTLLQPHNPTVAGLLAK